MAWASAGSPPCHQSAKARYTGKKGEAYRKAKKSNVRRASADTPESTGTIIEAAAWMDTHDGDISTDGVGEVGLASPVAAMTDAPKGWQCVDSWNQAQLASMRV